MFGPWTKLTQVSLASGSIGYMGSDLWKRIAARFRGPHTQCLQPVDRVQGTCARDVTRGRKFGQVRLDLLEALDNS